FQAEDGIRDRNVTGVQTCALPICNAAIGFPKPAAYMNLSGKPIAALLKFYNIPIANLIVIHDELDINFGALRIKRGGGEGGHNEIGRASCRERVWIGGGERGEE